MARLTISLQAGRTISGFPHLILPEHLAKQAVWRFESVEMQFFTLPWRQLVDTLANTATVLLNNDSKSSIPGHESALRLLSVYRAFPVRLRRTATQSSLPHTYRI